jgi:hypothetical protein
MCGARRLRRRSRICARSTGGAAVPIPRAAPRRHFAGRAKVVDFEKSPQRGPRECLGRARCPRRASGQSSSLCAPRSSAFGSAESSTFSSSDTPTVWRSIYGAGSEAPRMRLLSTRSHVTTVSALAISERQPNRRRQLDARACPSCVITAAAAEPMQPTRSVANPGRAQNNDVGAIGPCVHSDTDCGIGAFDRYTLNSLRPRASSSPGGSAGAFGRKDQRALGAVGAT